MLLEHQDSQQDANKLLEQAAYWFSQAAKAEPKALFEHGVALLHGYQGESQLAAGEKAVTQAANANDIEAIALLGYFYLTGSELYEINLDKAFDLLNSAAERDHPEAMANLGVYYYQLENEAKAFYWINKAAQAGNPHSQYHLALLLESGLGCKVNLEESLVWLHEAAEQGQLDAMLAMAKKLLAKESLTELESQKVQTYLSEVIAYARSVPAMLELSVALADGVLGRIDIVEAASLLSRAQHYANENELEVILPLKSSMLLQIEQVSQLTKNAKELATLNQAKQILNTL